MNRKDWIGAAIAVFLAVVAAFGLVVGVHDLALRDEPFAVSVVAVVLLAAGVLVLVGSVLLFLVATRATRKVAMSVWLGRLVLSACLVVAGAGSFFAVGELASFDTNALVLGVAVLVVGIAVASLIFLVLVTKVTPGKVGPTVLALVGTAFSVFQFWFVQQYLPTRQPPALEATTVLEPTGVNLNGLVGYRATVTLKNVGSTKVIALAGAYTVSGSQIASEKTVPSPGAILGPFMSTAPDPYARRFSHHSREKAPTIVEAMKLFAENRYFEAGEKFTREFAVFVPPCRYGLLRLRTHVVVAKGALLRIGDKATLGPGVFSDPGRTGVYAQWHIEDNSWVHDILEGKEQSILVNYVSRARVFDVSFFNVSAWLVAGSKKRSGEEIAKYTARARERLGLADTFSDFELPVKRPAHPAAAAGDRC